jgi:hypothetical protein
MLSKKDRVMNALKHKAIDEIPWTMYASYPPWSDTELGFRNEGLTYIYQHFPICLVSMNDVRVTEDNKFILHKDSGRNTIIMKFTTPAGQISVTHEFVINSLPGPGDLIQYFGSNIDQELLSWVTDFPFKSEADYEVLDYIYRNTEFTLNDDEFLRTEKIIGDEGVVFALMGKSPFQMLLYELMGAEKCYLAHYSNVKKFNKLYELLYEKQKEKYLIAAESSAEVFWAPENITSILTPPEFFKEYYVPFYNEMADILHRKGKLYAVHMDGTLALLAGLIKDTKIDIIEAFTPPPMGDINVAEAMKTWGDKVIWINFPGTLLAPADFETIEKYTIDMIRSIAPGDNFLIGCTENYPLERWELSFGAVASAIKKAGKYPVIK